MNVNVNGPVCACCGRAPARTYEITCEACAGWEERALDHMRIDHRPSTIRGEA